jgi:hypothetical protein
MKGACNLFSSFFLFFCLFFKNVWVFGASARKDEMFREIVDRRDASTIEKEREREMMMTFPYLFSLSLSRSLPIAIFTFDDEREREKKAT